MRNGDSAAKDAIAKATRANVDRLEVLEGFKKIVAPFNGISSLCIPACGP